MSDKEAIERLESLIQQATNYLETNGGKDVQREMLSKARIDIDQIELLSTCASELHAEMGELKSEIQALPTLRNRNIPFRVRNWFSITLLTN